MKITVPATQPRNPFATAARARHAGAHRRGASGQRQQHQAQLREELRRLRHP